MYFKLINDNLKLYENDEAATFRECTLIKNTWVCDVFYILQV